MRRVERVPTTDVECRFRELYEATLDDVYGFLSLRVGGKRALAEDLTAETYAAAVRQFNAGRSDEVTISWLRTVARRRLVDHWRKETTAAQNIVRLAPSRSADPADWVDRNAVIIALGQLGEDQRRALVLQYVEGYSVADVGALLGRTTKATESLLARARASFRKAFKEANDD